MYNREQSQKFIVWKNNNKKINKHPVKLIKEKELKHTSIILCAIVHLIYYSIVLKNIMNEMNMHDYR